MANKTFKAFVDKLGGTAAGDYIGNEGELFYDPTTTTLRVSDGSTPGGTVVSGGGGGSGVATSLEDGDVSIFNDDGDLEILNTDDDIIISTRDGGDDVFIYSGDDIIISAGDLVRVEGGNKVRDSQGNGGNAILEGGDGATGSNLDAGNGGTVTIRGGQGGVSDSAVSGRGGTVTIEGGYTERPGYTGGDVIIRGGSSNDTTRGNVAIGFNNTWVFDEENRYLKFPLGSLSSLGTANATNSGARAMINDSNLDAANNFGQIATDGGSAIVPVYSDGTNWRIG